MKYDSIPYLPLLCMTDVHVWHDLFQKPPFLSVHTKTISRRFQKTPLWRPFSKDCVSGAWKQSFPCGRKAKTKKTLHFQKYPEKCGRPPAPLDLLLRRAASLRPQVVCTLRSVSIMGGIHNLIICVKMAWSEHLDCGVNIRLITLQKYTILLWISSGSFWKTKSVEFSRKKTVSFHW